MNHRPIFENFGQFQSVQNSITSPHIIYGWNHHEILFNSISSNSEIGKVLTADIPVETGGHTVERAENFIKSRNGCDGCVRSVDVTQDGALGSWIRTSEI